MADAGQVARGLAAIIWDMFGQDTSRKPTVDTGLTILVAELGITKSTPPDQIEAILERQMAAQPLSISFDHDPAALAWAQGKVLEVTGQWRARAQRHAEKDMDENAEKWRRIAQITENALIGGKTDDWGAFDERHGTPSERWCRGPVRDRAAAPAAPAAPVGDRVVGGGR